MGKTKTIFSVAALSAAIITGGSAIAFAEGTADDTAVYSYTTVQQKYTERHRKFAKVSDFATDAEREAYFAEEEIGKSANPYDTADEEVNTSDYSYAKGKQRHTVSEYDGKSVEEQLADGTVTQEEADIMKAEAHRKHDEIQTRYAE